MTTIVVILAAGFVGAVLAFFALRPKGKENADASAGVDPGSGGSVAPVHYDDRSPGHDGADSGDGGGFWWGRRRRRWQRLRSREKATAIGMERYQSQRRLAKIIGTNKYG